MYTVRKIESKPRSFLKALNHGLRGNVNEITLHLQKKYFFGLLNTHYKAEGIIDKDIDINRYLKVGDSFNPAEYPQLKLK